jgi:subtilisin family serine protease
MATPHVAGLAAMLLAYNPNYTASDVVSSIRNGGETVAALAGKSTTSKAVNAMGSLSYINAPTGVSAVKQ